eukprot:m.59336 g.59336  ORF g.59336 m.59336 type:complete len:64 (-) comp11766_c0_seq2:3196-3387(-)
MIYQFIISCTVPNTNNPIIAPSLLSRSCYLNVPSLQPMLLLTGRVMHSQCDQCSSSFHASSMP